MFKMMIIEDETRTREGLKSLIQKFAPDFELIGEASNGLEGYELIKTLNPDVVISDIKMPFCDGLEMIKKLRAEDYKTKFILLTGYADFDYAKTAISLQVEEYLLKPIIIPDLTQLLDKIKLDLTENHSTTLSIETKILNYIDGTSGNEIFEDNSTLMMQKFEANFIYIPTFVLEEHLNIILNIKSTLTQYHQSLIMVEVAPHLILLLSEHLNTAETLSILHKHIHPSLATMYKQEVYLSDLKNLYNQMYEKRYYFLSCGTHHSLSLSQDYIFDSIDPYYVSTLISKFHTLIYEQTYTECPVLLKQLNSNLQNHNFAPEEILFTYSSLFNKLIKHIKDLFKKDGNFPYNQLAKSLSHAKTFDEVDYVFNEVFIYIANIQDDTKNYSLLVQKVLTKIHNEYMYTITLQEVADSLGITHIYLSTLFHQELGVSFKEYLTDIRMTKAKHLIKNSNLKVYEIASSVGYNDSKHFCTQFKKFTGLSPSQYQTS